MSLFVLSCKDGWVSIMYDGLDAVGVDQQVNECTSFLASQVEVERDNGEHSVAVRCIPALQLCFMSASGGARMQFVWRRKGKYFWREGRREQRGRKGWRDEEMRVDRASLLTQDLHCLPVCALLAQPLSSSSSPTSPCLNPSTSLPPSFPLSANPHYPSFAAEEEPQPLDAAVFHLLPAHRQLLRAEHVCGRGGGKLPQVSAAAGGGGGTAAGGEAAEAAGEEEAK